MRARFLCFVLLIPLAGCVGERVKVGCVRAEKYATQKGVEGDALGAAIGREMGAVNRELGATATDPAAIPLTAEAADSNAQAIDAAREVRALIWGGVKSFAGKLAESWPPLAGIAGALSAAGALFLKLKKYRATVETMVDAVGKVNNPETKEQIRTYAADAGVLPFLDKIVQRIDPAKG